MNQNRISLLQKVKPNEHVANGLVNVIGAYVWVARLFNGDVLDPEKIVEVAGAIICLSSYLSKSGLFKNIEHAVADVPMNACRVSYNLSEHCRFIINFTLEFILLLICIFILLATRTFGWWDCNSKWFTS